MDKSYDTIWFNPRLIYWRNFPMTRSVRRSVGRSVCQKFLWREVHFHSPIGAIMPEREYWVIRCQNTLLQKETHFCGFRRLCHQLTWQRNQLILDCRHLEYLIRSHWYCWTSSLDWCSRKDRKEKFIFNK